MTGLRDPLLVIVFFVVGIVLVDWLGDGELLSYSIDRPRAASKATSL